MAGKTRDVGWRSDGFDDDVTVPGLGDEEFHRSKRATCGLARTKVGKGTRLLQQFPRSRTLVLRGQTYVDRDELKADLAQLARSWAGLTPEQRARVLLWPPKY